jgi:hypothetical protein
LIALCGNVKAEMRAQNALRHAAVARDVIARRQNREPCRLEARNAPQQLRGFRAPGAVPVARHAEAEQNEDLPMITLGDVLLIRGDLVECWQAGAILQQHVQLGADPRPVRFDRREKGKGAGIMDRPILDESLARDEAGDELDDPPAGALHEAPSRLP